MLGQFTWIDQHSADYQLTVGQELSEYRSGCPSTIDQNVDQGYQLRVYQSTLNYNAFTKRDSIVLDNFKVVQIQLYFHEKPGLQCALKRKASCNREIAHKI